MTFYTSFRKYEAYDLGPRAGEPDVFATQIDEDLLPIAVKQWKLENARLGDFIILGPNGSVSLVPELDFGDAYVRPEPVDAFHD